MGIIFLFIIAGYVSANYFQLMLLQGNSMEPAYHNGQFLILDKYSKDYTYGDVIAIKKEGISGYVVKRIVGVPGDLVCIRDGVLYVNEEVRSDLQQRIDFAGIAEEEIFLGEDRYFVLGDNLQESIDSRYEEIGLINRKEIKGKVIK
ncbi:MAG: signal peptidase I [Acetatifactor sp.]|nr:signal peptidase I [Acetatifactor sp.]